MSVCSELPVGTDAARYVQRHGKVDGVFHGVAHQFGDLVAFSRRDFHYQFIVNLQNDTALDVSLGQGLLGAIIAIFMMSAADP